MFGTNQKAPVKPQASASGLPPGIATLLKTFGVTEASLSALVAVPIAHIKEFVQTIEKRFDKVDKKLIDTDEENFQRYMSLSDGFLKMNRELQDRIDALERSLNPDAVPDITLSDPHQRVLINPDGSVNALEDCAPLPELQNWESVPTINFNIIDKVIESEPIIVADYPEEPKSMTEFIAAEQLRISNARH